MTVSTLAISEIANLGNASVIVNIGLEPRPDFMSVGGITEPNADGICHHFSWAVPGVCEGTRVEVVIVESENCVPPTDVYRAGEHPTVSDEVKRDFRYQQYLSLKEEFEP